ncbi:NAD-dependent epimerase/dehydratase family protein [Azospirillum rugosum]|uniref:Dihydroflavonol-4-reductase n=1 Tax=Azospirillum rugosum TaxID=416170 RepID=A0ABS4STB0_9PROT|nr:NAD-dependent epimerase/dehydratase family protein [Azospirillum rugosum]MBP2295799.1 dihydroflavonol-4-reductase [Azospirillum rugosum]MDQ0529090.1 dihydroflavonol-4-reductase [Azospirillum rugosum]
MALSLVTGGCGFIGSHLVAHLLASGERVRVLDTCASDTLPRGVEMTPGSILDPAAVDAALDGVQTLYHVAGLPQLWLPDKEAFDRINWHGTECVLERAKGHRLQRIVHCSTEAVLLGRRPAERIAESADRALAEMAGSYCRSKYRAEQAALAAAAAGQPVVIANPTAVIGPGGGPTPPMAMLALFLRGGPRFILDCTLNLVDVRDVAAGLALAARHGAIGERYLIGGTNIRLSALVRLLDLLMGRKPRRRWGIPGWLALGFAQLDEWISDHVSGKPPTAPVTGVRLAIASGWFDTSKAVAQLHFQTRPFAETLADAVAWLVEESHRQDRPTRRSPVAPPVAIGASAQKAL